MILGFSQHFDKAKTQPTYFREKILAGCDPTKVTVIAKGEFNPVSLASKMIEIKQMHPKLTTIRAGHRWRPGMSIQMAYGVRSGSYQQFNKGIPELSVCKGVQEIEILPDLGKVAIDGGLVTYAAMEKIAKNDGFESREQFFAWFNKQEVLQLIHWSDLRY